MIKFINTTRLFIIYKLFSVVELFYFDIMTGYYVGFGVETTKANQ